jgi:hypothetical protein
VLGRREFLRLGVASAIAGTTKLTASAPPSSLVLVHGRDQQGRDPTVIKSEWIEALKQGAQKVGRKLPSKLNVAFAYYGDTLDAFARQFDIPLTSDIQTKGRAPNDDFLSFQADVGEALRQRAGITDAQINSEYGPNPKPRGPQNWEWVQAILRALDKYGGGLNQVTLEAFTRDVFLYSTRAGVRDEIDRIVARSITENSTVVVGHSLGSIVAYSVLRSDKRHLQVPLLVTVGSPLGVRAIRDQFRPLRYPQPVESWYNAFDKRDVVALYPLDAANFPVTPAIENFDRVRNHTSNRHGIIGYLDNPNVAKRILDAVGS